MIGFIGNPINLMKKSSLREVIHSEDSSRRSLFIFSETKISFDWLQTSLRNKVRQIKPFGTMHSTT